MTMIVKSIEIAKLYISELNVRKTASSVKDESNIEDLANDIKSNGLINPITVSYNINKDNYEIIAGSRRYKAMLLLNALTIPCNIIDVECHKAEEISLVENINRNQMTTYDKVKAFAKLSEVCEDNIDTLCRKVNISKATIQKYLKIKDLPEELLKLLDNKTSEYKKISVDLAIQLVNYKNLPNNKLDVIETFNLIEDASNSEKIATLEKYIKEYEENYKSKKKDEPSPSSSSSLLNKEKEPDQSQPSNKSEYEHEIEYSGSEEDEDEDDAEAKENAKEKAKEKINNIKEDIKTKNKDSKNWSNQNKTYKFLDPYVIDKQTNEVIIIPATLYEEIVELIKSKTGGNPCILKL
jgi:ParB/RepB/Spo0J family partition protein